MTTKPKDAKATIRGKIIDGEVPNGHIYRSETQANKHFVLSRSGSDVVEVTDDQDQTLGYVVVEGDQS